MRIGNPHSTTRKVVFAKMTAKIKKNKGWLITRCVHHGNRRNYVIQPNGDYSPTTADQFNRRRLRVGRGCVVHMQSSDLCIWIDILCRSSFQDRKFLLSIDDIASGQAVLLFELDGSSTPRWLKCGIDLSAMLCWTSWYDPPLPQSRSIVFRSFVHSHCIHFVRRFPLFLFSLWNSL